MIVAEKDAFAWLSDSSYYGVNTIKNKGGKDYMEELNYTIPDLKLGVILTEKNISDWQTGTSPNVG